MFEKTYAKTKVRATWNFMPKKEREDLSDFYAHPTIIDRTPPVIVPNPPTLNDHIQGETAIKGKAEVDVQIKAFVNGTQVGTSTTNASGAFSIPTSAFARNAVVGASACREDKCSTRTEKTVKTKPNAATLNAHTAGETTIKGKAEVGMTAKGSINGIEVGTAKVDASGNFSITCAALVAGQKVSAIICLDNVCSAKVERTVDVAQTPIVPSDPISYTCSLSKVNIKVGQTTTVRMLQNNVTLDWAVCNYESSDPSVVTVNERGTTTGVSVGAAVITLKHQENRVTINATITEADPVPPETK